MMQKNHLKNVFGNTIFHEKFYHKTRINAIIWEN